MSFLLSTLHVFGYGETQVIGQDGDDSVNKKTATSNITKVQQLVDSIYALKPQDSDASQDYHAINIFNGMFVDYQPKTGKSYRVEYSEINNTLVQEVVDEVLAFVQ